MVLTNVKSFLVILAIWSWMLIKSGSSTCYFPDYLLGEYMSQSPGLMQVMPSKIQYSGVSITPEAITGWGFCQKKISDDLYLIDNLSNSSYCIRCFHISIKSPNVVVVRTSGNPDRCFVSMPAAENSCPKAEYLENSRQMILYKTSKDIKKVNCPFNGRYMIQYKKLRADGHSVECFSRSSEISNCPIGSELKIKFQECPFESHDITFECLGSWNGPSNQQYLALYDTQSGNGKILRPQYRCGLYLEDSVSGTVYVAFSSDSTCLANLKSSQSGFETLVLTPFPNTMAHVSKCRFPDWLEGEWDSAIITENLFTYTDQILFTTYTFQCLNYDESGKRYDFPITTNDDKKMLVYGKSRCGEELHTCIWAKRRGINVFEFQLAKYSSPNFNASLCSSSNFQPDVWITQARQNYIANSPCPVEGEYVGTIPNAEGLCAKLSSDCSSLDTMLYTVSDCSQQIYEDTEKRRRYKRDIEQTVESTSLSTTPMNSSISTPTYATDISSTSANMTEVISTSSSINDSLVIETNDQHSRAKESTPSPLNNVQSYFIENKNLSALLQENAGFNIAVQTFLPPPVASSTSRPSVVTDATNSYMLQNQPVQYYYNQNYKQPWNPYYQDWNRSRGPESSITAGQIYFVDPSTLDKQRRVIALPPVQLPAIGDLSVFHNNLGGASRRRTSFRIFKDREYRCLGQWQENGFTYTFAERKNAGTYECFVGAPISETEFSIREAGRHCERDYDSPSSLSMILTKKTSCTRNQSSSDTNMFPSYTSPPNVILPNFVPMTTTLQSPPPMPETTITVPTTTTTKYTQRKVTVVPHITTVKPWRPITNSSVGRPQSPYRNKKMGVTPNSGLNLETSITFRLSTSLILVIFSKFVFSSD